MLAPITAFLDGIGIATRAGAVPPGTVLPGVLVAAGTLVYDEAALASPGDLLHEAGHLALLTPAERAACDGDVGADGGLEMGAMAWSWAALTHLGIAPEVVFHQHAYRGETEAIVAAFTSGGGPGVPILVWKGLTTAEEWPRMLRWLVG